MKEISKTEVRGSGKRKILYGWMIKYDDGTCIYVAKRKHRQIYRGGCGSITEAITEKKAGWAIDVDMLLKARTRGAQFIAVLCEDNGDYYLTPIENYFKRGQYTSINYTGVGRGGSEQKVVSLSLFHKTKMKIALPEHIIES